MFTPQIGLTAYFGNMGSGKTQLLIEMATSFRAQQLPVCILAPMQCAHRREFFARHTAHELQSRSGSYIAVDEFVEKDAPIVLQPNVIYMIDEANLLSATQIGQLRNIAYTNSVYTFGLRCDYKMNVFVGAAQLFLLSDYIYILNTVLCSVCKTRKSSVNVLMSTDTDLINGEYVAKCFTCFAQ